VSAAFKSSRPVANIPIVPNSTSYIPTPVDFYDALKQLPCIFLLNKFQLPPIPKKLTEAKHSSLFYGSDGDEENGFYSSAVPPAVASQ
jgi:hypothetical protein